MNNPCSPSSLVSLRAAIRSKLRAASSGSPHSCAVCARNRSVSGSSGAFRLASSMNLRAATASPEPTATRPCETARYPRAPRRLRRCCKRRAGERTTARTSDHSIVVTAATAASATTSTMTEVSMRCPSQVMTTSPGRSATHTAPNASNAITRRKTRIRIIARSPIAAPQALPTPDPSFGEPREGIGSQALACLDGGRAVVRAVDPRLRRRAEGRRKTLKLGERTGDIALRRLHADTRHNILGIVPLRLLQRANADELLSISLQFFEEAAIARWASRSSDKLWDQRGELACERGGAWDAGCRERLKRVQ